MRALLVGFCALLICATSVQAAPPLRYVGVVEDAVRVPDLQTAREKMQLVKDAGFNSVKITVPWTYPGQAEVINDKPRVCNAAQAAQEQGLSFFLTIIPSDAKGRPGNPPQYPRERSKFAKTASDWLYVIRECVPEMAELNLEIGNEPNSSTFWRPQTDSAGNWVAPASYAQLLARVYAVVKKTAADLKWRVNVIAGGLASAHNPLDFFAKMGANQKTQLFDMVSVHPYDGGDIGIGDYAKLLSVLQSSFGWTPPVIYSEYGVNTTKQAGKTAYTGAKPAGVMRLSENLEASAYIRNIALAASQGASGFFLFHLFDDCQLDTGWQSGLYYCDGVTPKSSLLPVSEAIKAYTAD